MKRRPQIEVERESDGLGYHAVIWTSDGKRVQVKGYEWGRFATWRHGRRNLRKMRRNGEV